MHNSCCVKSFLDNDHFIAAWQKLLMPSSSRPMSNNGLRCLFGFARMLGILHYSVLMEFPSVPFLFMMAIKNRQLPQPLNRGSCPLERNLILMSNDISFLTGINDKDLKIDKTGVEDTGKILTLPIACVPTILLIRKQKYIFKPSPQCLETVTKVTEIKRD